MACLESLQISQQFLNGTQLGGSASLIHAAALGKEMGILSSETVSFPFQN